MTHDAAAIVTASGLGTRCSSPVFLDVPGAQVDEQGWDVDLHRAGVVARAAQRRCVRQRGVVLHAGEQRRQHRADRARVDRAVRVAAGALVDRAHVQARRAPDAVQRLPAGLVGERGRPPVVQQHQVELLRAVARGHPGPHGGVRVHPLGRRRPGQQLQEHAEVPPGRDHLLDAHDRDQGLRQGQAHPAVALGLHHGQRAGLGDGEVDAADADPWRTGRSSAGAAARPRPARAGCRSAPGRRRPSRAGRSPGSPPGCGGWRAPGSATAGRGRAAR